MLPHVLPLLVHLLPPTFGSPAPESDVSRILSPWLPAVPIATAVLGAVAAWLWARRRGERTAAELRRRLEDCQESCNLGLLAGGIVHDFNNVLTAVRGHLKIVLRNLETGKQAVDGTLLALSATERAMRLSEQLLTAYSTSNEVDPRAEPGQVVRDLRSVLSVSLRDRVRFETSIDSTIRPIRLHSGDFSRVLFNLVVNAAEAMPKGGEMRVALDTHPEDARFLRLSVADTGAGIDPAVAGRVFEPRVSTKPGGSGLGLAVVQRIANGCGGKVSVESTPGAGARFVVDLPYA